LPAVEPDVLAAVCAQLLDRRKAEDIVMLRVGGLTSIADYFLIASARNTRQLDALSEAIQDGVARLHVSPIGIEGTAASGWILVDLGDVVVHLFDVPRRELYGLEVLWGDAPQEDWAAVSLAGRIPRQ